MADPLSITASIVTPFQVSFQVTIRLKQFRDETAVVDIMLSEILEGVDNFQQTLESMKETLDVEDVSADLSLIGHVGSHWRNLTRSLKELKRSLVRLNLLRILYKQLGIQKSTNQISSSVLPSLDRLHDEFPSFGSILNAKIEDLKTLVTDQADRTHLDSMTNLRECVRSAADVVSSASTALTADASNKSSIKWGSDVGEVFRRDNNEIVLRWMRSSTIYELPDNEVPHSPMSVSSTDNTFSEYHSDSDSDIENDIIRGLLSSGKKKKE
ncbi:hypothetical protein K491DRAFT_714050 [Lophiostoma macrostomum CBS 122681]|uniref:Fungal N-terminal domain-containing protein n=1 Tax=Lophiostoma macrostomum CBS 122681 TaxID=1314788 RepID=A0A6A6TF21_9PLEO|nr:hypothetical protein K491DRAFT_714050 [Lophiostoma macrostomum CBS 122681]